MHCWPEQTVAHCMCILQPVAVLRAHLVLPVCMLPAGQQHQGAAAMTCSTWRNDWMPIKDKRHCNSQLHRQVQACTMHHCDAELIFDGRQPSRRVLRSATSSLLWLAWEGASAGTSSPNTAVYSAVYSVLCSVHSVLCTLEPAAPSWLQ
jgi:hypothetical protein